MHASPGQTETQVDPSFQLTSSYDSVWPGLMIDAVGKLKSWPKGLSSSRKSSGKLNFMAVTQLAFTWVG